MNYKISKRAAALTPSITLAVDAKPPVWPYGVFFLIPLVPR
jgi:hypothetical protein